MEDNSYAQSTNETTKFNQAIFYTRNRLGNGINLLISNPFKEGDYNSIFKQQAPSYELPISWRENQHGTNICSISDMTAELSAFYEVDKSIGKNGGAFRDYISAQIGLDIHKSNKYLMHRYQIIHKTPYVALDSYSIDDLEPQFIEDCNNLTKDTAHYFFHRWGTHYTKVIYKEASFFLWSKFSSQNSEMSASLKAEIKKGIENGVFTSMTSGSVAAKIRTMLNEVEIQFTIETHCNKECPINYNDMLKLLGEEGSYGEAKQKQFDQWLHELRDHAVENYYDFMPLYDLPHFDKAQREHLQRIYNYYLSMQWRLVEITSGPTTGAVNAKIMLHGPEGEQKSHQLKQKGYVYLTAVQDGLKLIVNHSHSRENDYWSKAIAAQNATSSGFFFFATSQWSDKEMRPDLTWMGGLLESTAYIDSWSRSKGSYFRYVMAGKEGKLGQDRFTKDGKHKRILVLEARLGLNSNNQFVLFPINKRYIS
ncbi:MAC/perforin domain-containing protein [Aquimarina gracilis]|uniref:MAC/perforin domain-containing protein n=1 Tax=Aquimarina gracilis TaxID=874422 RepID=A0ABU5ZV48_9FLAO|nr:MAC/perforin domain-containing protein [Aquimarina gracilis]MEB3345760.1 MAC/perforin domain-containing protein [Aquimarina gracilis]